MAEEPVVVHSDDEQLLHDLDSVQVSDTSNSQQKIQKVPEFMRRQEDLKKYYEPSEIAIGPLHADSDDKLKKKELKVKFTRKFIETGFIGAFKEKASRAGGILLKEIKKNINKIKQSFDETVINNIPDDRLARMLLLDGCSVLEFIRSYVDGDLTEFNINNGLAALIQQDLFLLENQIPFRLLTLLMKLSERRNKLMLKIYLFILVNCMVPMSVESISERCERNYRRVLSILNSDREPVHLLDFLRSEILLDDTSPSAILLDDTSPSEILLDDTSPGLFRQNNAVNYIAKFSRRLSFRNVQDLKKAGVNFKPSYIYSLRSVSFSSRFFIAGQLKLPQLIVNASTAPKLLNLAAYEMCFANYSANNEVTAYLSFLDSLIDSEEDVRDLRYAHIIQNHLSSDAEVAQLFNSMGKNLGVHDAYLDVKEKIQKHYQRRSSFWIAQVYTDHFRTPWAILALLAATTILLLTAIQTYYAIHPKK